MGVPFTIPVRSKFGRFWASPMLHLGSLTPLQLLIGLVWQYWIKYPSLPLAQTTGPCQPLSLPHAPSLFFFSLSFTSPAVCSLTSPPNCLVPYVLSLLLMIFSSSAAPRRKTWCAYKNRASRQSSSWSNSVPLHCLSSISSNKHTIGRIPCNV
jgi:hypothetical protein